MGARRNKHSLQIGGATGTASKGLWAAGTEADIYGESLNVPSFEENLFSDENLSKPKNIYVG